MPPNRYCYHSHFINGETQAQRRWGIAPVHTASSKKSQDLNLGSLAPASVLLTPFWGRRASRSKETGHKVGDKAYI